MLHFLWILVAIVSLSFILQDASSDDNDINVKAEINDNEKSRDGSYFYLYLLDNGATQKITGTLKNVKGEKVYSVEGLYSYDHEDGNTLTVKYIADENGFRVLPVVSPNPPHYHILTQLVISPKAIQSLLAG